MDNDIENKATPFKIGAPSAVAATNADGTPLINFTACDYRSENLYSQVISPVAEKVNTIFITIGDDKDGAALCINIFKYLRQRRRSLDNLRIYVRCYTTEQEELIQQVASHYNEETGLNMPVIVPFGKEADLYAYKQVVDTEFRDKGKVYQEAYAKLRGLRETWDLRHDLLTGKRAYKETTNEAGERVAEMDKDGNPITIEVDAKDRKICLDKLSTLRRKEHQDEANALHALTKMYLLRCVLGNCDADDFLSRYFVSDSQGIPTQPRRSGSGAAIHYTELSDKENDVVRHLAMLEHLRWNAAHELLGYRRADTGQHCCNERTMQHNCLCDWEELDDESRATSRQEGWDVDYVSYDFNVVDTTIKMNLK